MIHVENELIDEGIGRLVEWLTKRGCDERTDVLYTSDHGELQGDYGLMFKGPYHTESLMRIPLLWRPAPQEQIAPRACEEPVGHVDLAPTFCAIAGVDVPGWMQGSPLPPAGEATRDHIVTTFDSQFANVGMHLRTIYRDGCICTAYARTDPRGGGRFPFYWSIWGRTSVIPDYTGSEGELYDVRDDPHQWHNLWDDPARRALREEMLEALRAHMPPAREEPLPVRAPT
jgi:arylsulfatase A-like enzyme